MPISGVPSFASYSGRRRLRLAIAWTLASGVLLAHAATPAMQSTGRGPLLASAIKQRDSGNRIQALALCEDVLQRWPNDPDALWLRVRLLSELGAANQALQLARQLDPPLAATEMAKLQADLAAHQARWAKAMPADARQPYAEADRAVATQDDALAHYGSLPDVATRVGADRLVSYDEASRSALAVSDYQVMRQAGKQPPLYAEAAVANALLQQRLPEQAIPLYEDSVKRLPGPYADNESDPHVSLMHAYLEAGRHREALALIDKTAANEPAWLPAPGSTVPRSNVHKVEDDLSAAQARENVWLYRDAWQRIDALHAQAPSNQELWGALAHAERTRGWPRRSENSLVSAAGLDPSDMGMRLDAIDAWRELNDFARVEPALREVEAVTPRDPHVQLTRTEWERQRGWQFDFEHDRGKGGTATFGDYDHETQATLLSPLLADYWRVYAITRLAGASLQEGHAERERLGVGVRAYARGLEAYVQALPGLGEHTYGTALEAGVKWFPSDHWTFGADWSSKGDADVPLRASFYRVVAKTLDVRVEWRASEMTSAKLTASHDRFSDGNRRTGWQGEVVQRLYTAPYLTLDGGVQLGTSRNRLASVPYYSPSSAHWGMLTGRLENMLYQRYERAWRQRLDVAIGSYQERYFGSSWAASARYGQVFQPRGGLAFGWGLSWNSQPYAGRREARVMLDLTAHWGE
ncbi:tetratricopeptide repeat protein [Dyella tabacisoli]|uniref:PgaA membrane beta barrel domain-containing protein n=1 Tax=Dyella tabacisoli TaxID=2282381 RepID=A0A369UV93_9GAMM|nr:tetratricopeptide repeat protein [Dyella tabacisoli]RDD82269.1 hypothetical protein DVJ77_07555 [Dyella tabacisoli]